MAIYKCNKYPEESFVMNIDFKKLSPTHTKDWYALYTDLMRKLKPALDEAGIEIPYPHRVISSKNTV